MPLKNGGEKMSKDHFRIGRRVSTPVGEGVIAARLLAVPDCQETELVYVALDKKRDFPGYYVTAFKPEELMVVD